MLTDLIYSRIKQKPQAKYIVDKSTPIPFFGYVHSARIATLSLNPSKNEFLAKNGSLLPHYNKRLEDLESLNVNSFEEFTDTHVDRIYQSCLGYFSKPGANPYNIWFSRMESLIKASLNMSYYDGSCCHLDIVQWATNPVWRGLPNESIQEMLEADLPFLKKLISNSQIELILINGKTTLNEFKKLFGDNIVSGEDFVLSINENPANRLKMQHGKLIIDRKEVFYVGWNLYRQQAIKQIHVDCLINAIKTHSAKLGLVYS